MKFTPLSLLALLFSTMSFAQPILTEANVGFQTGLSYNFESATFPTPLTTGANHTWSFGSLTSTGSNTYTFGAPSSFPQGSSFPTSNVAYSAGLQQELYYNTSSSQLDLVGIYGGGIVFTYTNDETWMKYPFTFGDSFTDTWACNYTSGLTFNRGGSTTVTADGYGTITLPNGTFNNILRINHVQNYADTASGMVFFSYVSTNTMWYLPGVHGFGIATSAELVATSAGGTQSSVTGGYMDPITPTSVNDIQTMKSFIDFYPNPVNNQLTIKATKLENGKVVICNMNGAIILTKDIKADAATQLDVRNLSNGQYLMHLSVDGRNVAGEIITVKH